MALTDYDVYQGLHPIEAIDQAITDIDTVKTYIPSSASAQNKLVTESNIETVEADIEAKQDELTTTQMAAVNSGATAEIIASISNKQDALSTAQMAAANSGITQEKVSKFESIYSEVIDERVGADGTSYVSAGDAVRGQIVDLKDDLLSLYDDSYDYQPISVASKVDSYEMRTDGSAREDSNYELVRYRVTAGSKIKVNISGAVSGNGLWAFYRDTGVITTNVVGEVHKTNTNDIITVPSGAVYLILSQIKNTTNNVVADVVSLKADLIEIENQIESKADTSYVDTALESKASVSYVDASTGEIRDFLGFFKTTDKSDFQNGTWVEGSGFSYDATRLRLIEQIPISVGTHVSISPSGQRVWYQILESPSSTTSLFSSTWSTDNVDFVSNYDGYLSVIVNKVDNTEFPVSQLTAYAKVDSTRIESLENSTESLSVDVQDVKDAIGIFKITKQKDFMQGAWESGRGFISSTTRLRLINPIAIKKGTRIKTSNNGLYLAYQILATPDATTFLSSASFSLSDFDFVSSYDGYLSVLVRNESNTTIVPDDNVAEVVVDGSRFLAIENSVDALSDNVSESAPTYPLSKKQTNILDACQSVTGWSNPLSGGTAPTLDTTDFLFGSASIKSTSTMQKSFSPIDMESNDLVVKIKVNSIASGEKLRLYISESVAFSSFYVYDLYKNYNAANIVIGEWVEIAIPFYSRVESSGSPNPKSIGCVRFMATGNNADYNVQYVGYRRKSLKRGVVSFTFDDGYDSQFDACKVLASKGLSGTIFTIPEAIGHNGFLTVNQCYSLKYNYGIDFQVHGDATYPSMTEEELEAYTTGAQEWLKSNSLGDGNHCAYPGGVISETALKVVRRVFKSARTIYSGVPLQSYPLDDAHRVRAVSAISSAAGGIHVSQVKNYIDGCEKDNSWLILVFHRMKEVETTMDCSIDDFTEIVDYALSKNVDIMNYDTMFM